LFDDLFLIEGRMGRKKYIIYVLGIYLAYFLMHCIFNLSINFVMESSNDNIGIILIAGRFTLFIFLNILMFILSFKRIQDINISGIIAIFCIIPYFQILAIIALMSLNGAKLGNKYGANVNTQVNNDEENFTLESI